ncbi:ABC transporter permease [Anaerovorax odorimutans]|uniref:ABC transporter permease n=2 Tax=Anaerovorax odorimutans TaxID=109327 RepID=A0ABT1RQR9_9FIRM|nr:FtsX-like permease family protein [Anaerovorax odorimutans]MCQ4637241.1 ABC transporter permease [Anaerovorax odorimutans]
MKRYLDLIPISAKVHRKQSRMTLICISLAVFLVTVIFGMADMEVRSQRIQAVKDYGNWHLMLKSADEKEAAMIKARPEVTEVAWYGVLNYRLAQDYRIDSQKAAVCGFNPEFLSSIFTELAFVEGNFPRNGEEAALTENAKERLNLKVGDSITLDTPGGKPFKYKISGFIENTSMLMKADGIGTLLNQEAFRALSETADETFDQDSCYYVQLSERCDMNEVIADIAEQYHWSEKEDFAKNTKLLATLGQSDDSFIGQLYTAAFVLFLLVLLAGILMIASSLNSNVMQRTEFFGMLRCLGASKKQIIRFVRLEAFQWCKWAVPIGILPGVAVVWVLCAVLRFLSPAYFAAMPAFGVSWISVICGAAVGLLTVLLAAQSPAKKAARVSPLTAVSGNAYAFQKVRRAANTRLFKVDTALGVHHAKASKKNFLLMAGSFALSIILFLAFSAAMDFMHHAIQPLKPYTPDISIVSPDNTRSLSSDLPGRLEDESPAEKAYGRMFAYDIPAETHKKSLKLDLLSYEKHQFQWAEDALLQGSLEDVRQKKDAVLTVYDRQNPLRLGDTVTLRSQGETKEVTIAGILSDSPFNREEGKEILICSEETFRSLQGAGGYTIVDVKLSDEASDQDVNEIRRMAGPDTVFSDRRASNAEAQGAYLSLALFIYGFLVVIALITVFNIINSIAMSVSARLRQYGAMRAIGMSSRQLIKMILAESATYAAASSIIGCIAGLPIHRFLYENLVTSRWGDPWQLPLGPLLLIMLLVAASSAAAVYGPAKRIHRLSIVDTISAQ